MTSETKPKSAAGQSRGSCCSALLRLAAVLVFGLLAAVSVSYIVTDTYDFNGLSFTARKLIHQHVPGQELVLTPEQLAQYDGSDPNKPIYLGINGVVYDVSAGPGYYGKGGSYNFFAGKDAARAYITGCFDKDLTHDLRGLNEAQIRSLSTWTDFYENHKKYFRVGRVVHPPIDPSSPVPEPCEA